MIKKHKKVTQSSASINQKKSKKDFIFISTISVCAALLVFFARSITVANQNAIAERNNALSVAQLDFGKRNDIEKNQFCHWVMEKSGLGNKQIMRRRMICPQIPPSPTPSCIPRPACLDAKNPCRLMPPRDGHFCAPSPTPITTALPFYR